MFRKNPDISTDTKIDWKSSSNKKKKNNQNTVTSGDIHTHDYSYFYIFSNFAIISSLKIVAE